MWIQSEGIVIRTIKYSESSVIAKIYTREFGLQSFIIKGVRGKKGKNKTAALQHLSLVEIEAYQKEASGLKSVKNIQLRHPYSSIPFNIVKSTIAIFISEVLDKVLHENEADEQLFNFIDSALSLLDIENNAANFHLIFLIQLTRFLGFQLLNSDNQNIYFDLESSEFTSIRPLHDNFTKKEETSLLRKLLGTNFAESKALSFTNSDRRFLLRTLVKYYQIHVDSMRDIQAHLILEAVSND